MGDPPGFMKRLPMPDSGSSTHLVAVWNPSYASTAMEAHLALLLEHARAWSRGADGTDPDGKGVYVWWGKIRSGNRQEGWAREGAP